MFFYAAGPWNKFSEVKPEKEGLYLCYNGNNKKSSAYIMKWAYNKDKYFWYDLYQVDSSHLGGKHQVAPMPVYWAEINLPEDSHL